MLESFASTNVVPVAAPRVAAFAKVAESKAAALLIVTVLLSSLNEKKLSTDAVSTCALNLIFVSSASDKVFATS